MLQRARARLSAAVGGRTRPKPINATEDAIVPAVIATIASITAGQRVERLSALGAEVDQLTAPQTGQVLGHRGMTGRRAGGG